MKKDSNKVFVIGLDGATWDILTPLIKQNKMPFLATLINNGVWGILESTIPPMTGPAWASFQTGLSPGSHGIFHFLDFDKKAERFSFVNSSTVTAPTIWEIVSQYGKKVVSINVPLTYPPFEINGIMISGMPVPDARSRITYPDAIYEKMLNRIKEYRLTVDKHVYYSRGLKHFINEGINTIQIREKAALYILQNYEWDLFMVHFQLVDVIQHALWHIIEKTSDHGDGKFAMVSRFYQAIDSIIGRLINAVNDSSIIIVMSDHGFGGHKKALYLNNWLVNQGLLALNKRWKTSILRGHLAPLIKRIDKYKLRALFLSLEKREHINLRGFNARIDWSKTAAYSIPSGQYASIFLTAKETDTKKHSQLKDSIIAALSELTDPHTGERIIVRIHRKEEIYKGSYLHKAPDIAVVARDDYIFDFHITDSSKALIQDINPSYQPTGSHRMDGILTMSGNSINKGLNLSRAKIIDLAPTILYALGMPIPSQMEGKVLEEVFSPDFLENNRPVMSNAVGKSDKSRGFVFSPEEQEDIEDMLKGLGYL